MQKLLKIAAITFAGSLFIAAPARAVDGQMPISGPINITAPGSYVVTNDITATFSAIQINSSNVTINLNGFTVSHGGSMSADGIVIGNYNNIEISNGAVVGFPRHGIFAPGGNVTSPNNIRLSNLRISGNRISGISLENHSGFLIQDCTISNNGALGIYANGAGLVSNNFIGNHKNGLVSYSGGHLGYRSNVFMNSSDVSGTPTNLGENLCSGTLCP